MNNFKPFDQPDSIRRVWKHFRDLGITGENFGQSKASGEITIRTEQDTAYVTKLSDRHRVTLRSAGKTQQQQRDNAKEYLDENMVIAAVEKALGLK